MSFVKLFCHGIFSVFLHFLTNKIKSNNTILIPPRILAWSQSSFCVLSPCYLPFFICSFFDWRMPQQQILITSSLAIHPSNFSTNRYANALSEIVAITNFLSCTAVPLNTWPYHFWKNNHRKWRQCLYYCTSGKQIEKLVGIFLLQAGGTTKLHDVPSL